MRTLDYYERRDAIAWRFETARFTVALVIEPEDSDPADSFEFLEDIEFARNGDLASWFQAGCLVFDSDGEQIGGDWLGACSYRSIDEFVSGHRDADPMYRNCSLMRAVRGNVVICHYFPSMVREACRSAREGARHRCEVASRLREVAA